MKPCNIKVPHRLVRNTCVHPGMGGHDNALINHVQDGRVECAKKYKSSEAYFYNEINALVRDGDIPREVLYYIPEYFGECDNDGNKYSIIENISGSLGSDVNFIDIKPGYKTTVGSGIIKTQRHRLLDTRFSISSAFGFRLEGISNSILNIPKTLETTKNLTEFIKLMGIPDNLLNTLIVGPRGTPNHNYKKLGTKKGSRYILKPLEIFTTFFSTPSGPGASVGLTQIWYDLIMDFLLPNLETATALYKDYALGDDDDFRVAIGLIGSSIFVSYSSDKLMSKLIDFDHAKFIDINSTIQEKKLVYEMVYNNTVGIVNSLTFLYLYIYTTFGTLPRGYEKNAQRIGKLYTLFIQNKIDTIF